MTPDGETYARVMLERAGIDPAALDDVTLAIVTGLASTPRAHRAPRRDTEMQLIQHTTRWPDGSNAR